MKPVCENITKSNVIKKILKAQKFRTLQTLELELIMATHWVKRVCNCFFGLYFLAFRLSIY